MPSSNNSGRSTGLAWPGGAQAAVTLSFDDGYAATCESTVGLLRARGWGATYNVITDYVGAVFEGLPTADWTAWREAGQMGHEIASHGARHAVLAGPLADFFRLLKNACASPNRLAYVSGLAKTVRALARGRVDGPRQRSSPSFPSEDELAASRTTIDCLVQGSPTESFAYPAGRHSAAARRAVATAGFRSARTLDWGLNDGRCDVFALRAVALGPALTVQDLNVWLERALAARAWLIIVLHRVAARNPTDYAYFLPLPEFERLLDVLQSRPLWIASQRQVLRYLGGRDGTAR